jgi:hypothetical protein
VTWFVILSGSFYVGGPYVQPIEEGLSPDMGCVHPSHVPLWEAHRIKDFGP